MVGGTDDASLRVLFGKAFLIQLERGGLETANLFARAFLVRTTYAETGEPVTVGAGARGVS